ncbi:MAG: hypothetical protein ABI886_15765 [Betaproteobacteria bacterium]
MLFPSPVRAADAPAQPTAVAPAVPAAAAKPAPKKPARAASHREEGTLVVFNRRIVTFRADLLGVTPLQRADRA